jgi:Putative peptidoglycan binding domain
MKRIRTKLMAGLAVAAGGAALIGVVTHAPRSASAAPSLDAAVNTATVTRQTISEQDQVNGTIGYAGSYSVLNLYAPSPSAATVAQAQHQVDAARQSLADTQASIDFTNQQDAAAVSADQSQLTQDQQKYNSDGCPGNSTTTKCGQDQQAINSDQAKLAQDQAKQQSDQIANQSKLHQAQQNLTSAQDSYNQKVQPGGGGGSGGGGGGTGVYTALPSSGQTVNRGQTLYAVNGRPIPLFFGGTPLARQLTVGVSGDDVKELEDNLIALGYGDGLIADGNFSQADATAVKRWQAALGVTHTGVVNPGEAVFLAGRLRVSQVKVATGASAQAGQEIIDGTSPDHVVSVNLDARKQTIAQVGAAVDVTLPNGSRVKGTITDVGTVATTSGTGAQQQTNIPVTVTLSDNAAAGKLDGATVTVYITRNTRKNVLTVPITALLALQTGGYAVETAGGRHRRIPVQTGIFSNGQVEISGPGIGEGLRVLAPSV